MRRGELRIKNGEDVNQSEKCAEAVYVLMSGLEGMQKDICQLVGILRCLLLCGYILTDFRAEARNAIYGQH